MPWCESCSRWLAPTALAEGATCPSCGRDVDVDAAEVEPFRAPWHFKVMVGSLIVYLAFRAWQGIGWLTQHV